MNRRSPWIPIPVAVLALAVLAVARPCAAQDCLPRFLREFDAVPLIDALGPVSNAWLGGLANPRPQLLDVDQDGDLDLFVAEDTGKLRFYRNDGSPSSPDWVFQTDDYAGVHELYFTRFVDLDADGDFDLLVEAPRFVANDGGVKEGAYLYTNIGTAQNPAYVNLSAHPNGYFTDENGEPIPFITTAPDFVDLEGDGDQDLVMGQASGAVILFRNVGTPQNAAFRFETDTYDGMLITPGACTPTEPRTGGAGLRHGFMLFSFFDIDADLAPDLFVGDQNTTNIYYWGNSGGTPSPSFLCQSENFFKDPFGGNEFFGIKALPAFGDLDGNGLPDALVSGEENTGQIYFYRNYGTAQSPFLQQESDDWIPEFDRTQWTAPSTGDVDGDGDLDLALGVGFTQEVSLYDNFQSNADPGFALTAQTWAFVNNTSWCGTDLADIDGDDDLDLLVGMTGGAIRWWRNDGSASPGDPPALVEITTDTDFGAASGRTFRTAIPDNPSPRFFDEDGDGDLDVLVGTWSFSGQGATLYFFRNDGSPTAHSFVLETTDYDDLGPLGQGLTPALGDLDSDGDPDLLVGGEEGKLAFVRNDGVPGDPDFVVVTDELSGIDVGRFSAPDLVDIDDDGKLDLLVGEYGGGLNLYRNVAVFLPSPFSLLEPAPGAGLDLRDAVRFDWESTSGPGDVVEATYELRITTDPLAPESEWFVLGGLSTSEITLDLSETPFVDEKDLYWNVVASNECGPTSPPEWRNARVVLAGSPMSIMNVFPSPTTGPATISYTIPRAGNVRIAVYDLTGRRVAVLHDGPQSAGQHDEIWNGTNILQGRVASGIYLVRVEFEGQKETRRIVRLQ